MVEKFNIVGKKIKRQDGIDKVTGKARFADDINVPDQLSAVMIRIPAVNAEILKKDFSAIENHPAVSAVCDSRDVPGENLVGHLINDQPVFCDKHIRMAGDVVAMLVGKNEEKLRRLVKKAEITYKKLPVLSDPVKALDKDAILIHPDLKSNLIVHYPLIKGDVRKGLKESDIILDQTYTTPFIEHAYLETEAVTAIPGEDEKTIKITGSIQNPFTTRKIVARVLGWNLNRVQVIQAELGGSFGGKDDLMNILSARAAVAALKTGKPVKIRYNREESILESYKRHPYIMKYKVGCKKNGKILAMRIEILADGGAYASMSPFVTWRSVVQATGPYEVPHVRTDVRAVYTNNPYTGAMRGFGSPQPIFAVESVMDELAARLNMNPYQLRKINGFKKGSRTASGQVLKDHNVNLLKVMDSGLKKSGFAQKWKLNNQKNSDKPDVKLNGNFSLTTENIVHPSKSWRKGIGMAISYRGCSLGAEGIDAAAAYLSVQPDGSVYLLSGLAENGQGLRTTFSIIASEVLGIDIESIKYLEMNTSKVPDSGPTVASRSTIMGGNAVKNAAETIRNRLDNVLRKQWKIGAKANIKFAQNHVYTENEPSKKMFFSELCALAYNKGENLTTIGWYAGPEVSWDEKKGQGSAYFTYVYGCQIAEISVNITTGQVFIEKITAVHDAGKIINKAGALGQVYGGVTQGAGYALWEELTTYDGNPKENNFDQFLIPTSKDIDFIHPVFIEGTDKFGPWGAKSLGEPTLELTAAAIANAVKNATGQRYFNLPLNIEEILLHKKLRPEDLSRGSL